MTYFSGFTSHQPCHANFKRIHRDFKEAKPCCVENNTKTVNSRFLSQASMGLILVFTIILIKTSSEKSKTRVGYIIFIIMTLWLCGTVTKSLDWVKIPF